MALQERCLGKFAMLKQPDSIVYFSSGPSTEVAMPAVSFWVGIFSQTAEGASGTENLRVQPDHSELQK